MQFYFILYYFILFYFILYYFILFGVLIFPLKQIIVQTLIPELCIRISSLERSMESVRTSSELYDSKKIIENKTRQHRRVKKFPVKLIFLVMIT